METPLQDLAFSVSQKKDNFFFQNTKIFIFPFLYSATTQVYSVQGEIVERGTLGQTTGNAVSGLVL